MIKEWMRKWLGIDKCETIGSSESKRMQVVVHMQGEIDKLKDKSHTHHKYNAMTDTEIILYKHIKALAEYGGIEFNKRNCDCGYMGGNSEIIYCSPKTKKK